MSWFGFQALSAAFLFTLAVPLILFYFLKLRRPRLSVPSLYLWQQVINDSRVNSPFQRFKRNLLLLLQLLLLLLVVLAAMQPFWQGREKRARRLPVLIDCSASMAALDAPGGISRLEAARRKVRKLIDEMPAGQELCLISFSRIARRRTGFTSNRRFLREALAQIETEDVPSDVEAPLRLAQALARSTSFDEVLLLSDGNLPARADFELSFRIDYQRLPPAGPNIGITALNATRARDGRWDVFLSIEGSASAQDAAEVVVTVGGNEVASERIVAAPGRAERITFRVPGEQAVSVEARLRPDAFDSLASDNAAFLDLPVSRPLAVYAAPSLASFRHALSALRTVRLFPEESSGVDAARSYDLAITDREADLAIEAGTLLTVGLVPPDLADVVAMGEKGTEVVDWRRNADILRHVELAELMILDQPQWKPEKGPADCEQRGYEIVADGRHGPLLLERRRGDVLACHLLFHADRSTLPYRIGFPIFVSNVVQMALRHSGLAGTQATRTGVLPPLPVGSSRACVVSGPGGYERREQSDKHGLLAGVPAPRVGRYRVAAGGATRADVGASLLSPSETTLDAAEEIVFNEDLSVAASGAPPRTDRSLWQWLALLGLCVLAAEWWLFHRRPGGFVWQRARDERGRGTGVVRLRRGS